LNLELTTNSPEETRELGVKLGELAQPGDVFLMTGELGAGKTCLTQGIAWGLGIKEYVLSPTFVIMRELYGRLPLYHMDLYRLDNIDESQDLGLDDYLYGLGLCVVEWADKALSILPKKRLDIHISYVSDTGRSFRFEARGERYLDMIKALRQFASD
jgi:tRNA threonylcarbamoyladenosine biosynthesis protein TsaE